MKRGDSERRVIFIYTSHNQILPSNHRLQSALVTVVNRKHCLIGYHGSPLNNAIVTTVYWRVIGDWSSWSMNLTWFLRQLDKLLLKTIAYVSYDDTKSTYGKGLLYTVCARECLNPYKDRKFKQAGWGGLEENRQEVQHSTSAQLDAFVRTCTHGQAYLWTCGKSRRCFMQNERIRVYLDNQIIIILKLHSQEYFWTWS